MYFGLWVRFIDARLLGGFSRLVWSNDPLAFMSVDSLGARADPHFTFFLGLIVFLLLCPRFFLLFPRLWIPRRPRPYHSRSSDIVDRNRSSALLPRELTGHTLPWAEDRLVFASTTKSEGTLGAWVLGCRCKRHGIGLEVWRPLPSLFPHSVINLPALRLPTQCFEPRFAAWSANWLTSLPAWPGTHPSSIWTSRELSSSTASNPGPISSSPSGISLSLAKDCQGCRKKSKAFSHKLLGLCSASTVRQRSSASSRAFAIA